MASELHSLTHSLTHSLFYRTDAKHCVSLPKPISKSLRRFLWREDISACCSLSIRPFIFPRFLCKNPLSFPILERFKDVIPERFHRESSLCPLFLFGFFKQPFGFKGLREEFADYPGRGAFVFVGEGLNDSLHFNGNTGGYNDLFLHAKTLYTYCLTTQ